MDRMIKFAILVSKKDIAGMNIKENLLADYDFVKIEKQFEGSSVYELNNAKIYTTEKDTVICDDIDENIDGEIIIFATRHQSSQGINCLTIHAPGNWGNNEMGGEKKKLCAAPALLMKSCFILLEKNANEKGYEITVEQTHHGPLISKPCFFIEIGSNEEQWRNKESGKIIAKTIMDFIESDKKEYVPAIFLGGGHYNHQATKIMLKTDYAIGHICAKHSLESFDEVMLKEAIEKTLEKPKIVILDWKGLGHNKSKVVEILEKNKIRYERSKNLLN